MDEHRGIDQQASEVEQASKKTYAAPTLQSLSSRATQGKNASVVETVVSGTTS